MSLMTMRRSMKNFLTWAVWGFVAIFAITAFLQFNPYSGAPGGSAAATSTATFARINGQDVPAMAFQREIERTRGFYEMMGQPASISQRAEFPKQAWSSIVRDYAEAEAAKRAGVNVSVGDAQKELNEQVEQQIKTLGEGATEEDLRMMRAQLRASTSVEAVRRNLAGRQFRDKMTAEARPIEMKVAHILIKAEKRTDQQARELAQNLAGQARSGADFNKLVKDNSEDFGSKMQNGVVGWASAMPPPPGDPKKKPDPEAATSFVPAFTAAALRLKPGQVSDPVRSEFGYHVIKALQERPYQPTDKAILKDAKKKQEAIDSYKNAVGSQMANGLISEYEARAVVEAKSPMLRGIIAEKTAQDRLMEVIQSGKPPSQKEILGPAITAYEEALAKNEPGVDEAFAYHLATLYQRMDDHQKAADLLGKYAKKRTNPELSMMYGDVLLKLKKKTEALAAYQEALRFANSNTAVLTQLATKFKEVGRTDLAAKARAQEQKVTANREAAQRAADAERKAQEAATKAAAKPAEGEVVSEVTVKTGPKDPKTGKVPIVSVEQNKPGEEKGHEGHNHPPGQGH